MEFPDCIARQYAVYFRVHPVCHGIVLPSETGFSNKIDRIQEPYASHPPACRHFRLPIRLHERVHRFRSNNKLDLSRQSLSLNLSPTDLWLRYFFPHPQSTVSVWIHKNYHDQKFAEIALLPVWLLQGFLLSIAFLSAPLHLV
ncbi:hypothetical protein SRABI80_04087 [Peribacillus frigoritolerans]|nr:hypothetical protein SRABI80_04087 [Peribacillus frigoritolerans]